jgi:hypothetical protein
MGDLPDIEFTYDDADKYDLEVSGRSQGSRTNCKGGKLQFG